LKVVVLTTSYPRFEGDVSGRFVSDAVERVRARGIDVDVVSPQRFRHFGLAYGGGVVHNLKRRPWALPPMLVSMTLAVRRAASTADVVHAHWLPSAGVAAFAGKPVVVTLHGTDVELARRAPALTRRILRRASVVVAVSNALAEQALRLGAPAVRVIPNGVEIPGSVGEEAEPPEVLFAGRLSPEKGVLELAEAADGLNLVVAGDGPLRGRLPSALGFLPPAELARLYDRSAVVVCPSRRDGFNVVCAEAMAHGRPVVASAVGGLLDLVRDGETGLLVPPRDPPALRGAIERLLADRELRRRLGASAREHVAELCDWERVVDATIAVYEDAAGSAKT
jgi:glycosyltransferase involved in cell wall biosynthesis